MAFTKPYITDKFTAYPGDVRITSLSLAVWVMDDFTKNKPAGNIKVMIKEGEIKAFQNLSWYYLFTDLPAGNYTVAVEADLYFPEEMNVDTSLLDPKNPGAEIILKPKPSYPFPYTATLARGVVLNTGPIVNAEIQVVGKTIKTITDGQGEFVLYFKGIKHENITIEIKKGGDTKAVNTTIEEGKTISMGIVSFP